jgi:2,3-bisphosphoglycerate-dependent phosphoglycerate mutase
MSNSKVIAHVYIVRHGETQENRDKIIQGQLDTSLNSLGRKQARLVGDALKEIPFDAAYSSDLKRAVSVSELVRDLRYGLIG